MRDHPFEFLTDDELFEASKLADQRYGEILISEGQPFDRAWLVDWIIKSGEKSVVCRENLDEMRRRRENPEGILNP